MKTKILKTLSLLLVLILAFGVLVACDNEDKEPEKTEPVQTGSTEPGEARPGVRTDGKANRVALILEDRFPT